MTKKNLLKRILFISFCITFNSLNVRAADISTYVTQIPSEGYSINVNVENNDLIMMLNAPESDSTSDVLGYKVIFSNSATEVPNLSNYVGETATDCTLTPSSELGKANPVGIVSLGTAADEGDSEDENNDEESSAATEIINVSKDWYIANGYTYAYIIEEVFSDTNLACRITQTPVEVTKPELPSLNEMYNIIIDSTTSKINVSSGFPYEETSTNFYGDHKMIAKIGIVDDENIINDITSNSPDGYANLLNYAKTNEGNTWNFILGDSSSSVDLSSFSMTNGKYYYVYTTFENASNLYRTLDGIKLAKVKNNIIDFDLTSSSDSEAESSNSNSNTPNGVTSSNTSNEESIENPKTGAQPLIVLGITVIVSLVLGIYAIRAQNQ